MSGSTVSPPPFTTEGRDLACASRRAAPIAELFDFGEDAARQMIATRTEGDESTVLAERQWFAEALAACEQRRNLALSVEGGTEVLRRLSPIAHVMASAELADEEFSGVMQRIRAERHDGMGGLVGALAARVGLRWQRDDHARCWSFPLRHRR